MEGDNLRSLQAVFGQLLFAAVEWHHCKSASRLSASLSATFDCSAFVRRLETAGFVRETSRYHDTRRFSNTVEATPSSPVLSLAPLSLRELPLRAETPSREAGEDPRSNGWAFIEVEGCATSP